MVKTLDSLAEKLLINCDDGDMQALKELGDRLDGKPAQAIAVSGDGEGGSIKSHITIEFVKPS